MSTLTVLICIQGVAAFIGLVSIFVIAIQKPSFYQKIMLLTIICGFISLAAYMFEISSGSRGEAFLAARVGYLGKSYVMVLFVVFITRYCDIRLPRIVTNFLLLFSTVVMVAVVTSPLHRLYYTSVEFVKDATIPHLVLGKGVLYYLFIGITMFSVMFYVIVVITKLIRQKGTERSRMILLCLAGALPIIALALNYAPFMYSFDPTPIGIMLSCILISLNVLKYGLLDIMQLAGENAMDYTGEGLVVVSKNLNFVYANKRAYEIFPELAENMKDVSLIKDLFGADDNISMKTRTYNKDDRIYELHYSSLSEYENNNDDRVGVIGYMAWIFDKTEEWRNTRELIRLRDEAEAANKAKTMFLANMSHEIRTPMNGIIGFASLALEKNLDDETREYISYIKTSADTLLKIINDVLDISKIESGKMEIVDVAYAPKALFEEISVLIESQAMEKGLEYIVNISDNLPIALCGDSVRFREILINILGNAVKYTNSGRITFDVKVEDEGPDIVWLEIHVRDTGVGIRADKLENIFDSFEQADSVGNYHVEGTGLGLSIARKLSVMMGGTLGVESVYGEGSDFCLRIPQKRVGDCIRDINSEEDVFLNDEFGLRVKNTRVLIVDDNQVNLKVEKKILERYGIETDVAESGIECLLKLEEADYDVILMDHMMPEMDGVDTFHEIRNGKGRNFLTPVLLVTANAIVGVKQEMLQVGFDGFVSKPIDIKLLERELLKVLPADKTEIVAVDMTEETERETEMQQEDETVRLIEKLKEQDVDTDTGLQYCGGVTEYMEVLDIMVETTDSKLDQLVSCVETEDWENYTILVHSIKSGAANIGAMRVSMLAKQLEQAGRERNTEYIYKCTQPLVTQYKKLIQVIREERSKMLEEVSPTGETPVEENSDEADYQWDRSLSELTYLIEELETEQAEELVQKMLLHLDDEAVKNILCELKEYLNHYDIEGAKARLQLLKNYDIKL